MVDAFTHPKFRGGGVGALSTVVGLHRAAADGCRRWLALVARWNARALRNTQDRAGATAIGSLSLRARPWGRSGRTTGRVHFDRTGAVTIDD